jgi:hypothetical protein
MACGNENNLIKVSKIMNQMQQYLKLKTLTFPWRFDERISNAAPLTLLTTRKCMKIRSNHVEKRKSLNTKQKETHFKVENAIFLAIIVDILREAHQNEQS